MKTATGWCKYCGQAKTVQVDDQKEYTQEELDRIADSECDCDLAKKAQEKDNRIRRAKDSINKITLDGEKDVGDFLKNVLPLLADHRIKKISVNLNGIVTYAMWRGSEDQLNIQRKETITEEDEVE